VGFVVIVDFRRHMIEWIARLLEAIAKYSWGVVAVCLFVLFLQHKQAEEIGILKLRADFLPYWWIVLLFSGTICAGNIFAKTTRWIGQRKNRRRDREMILHRLGSLDQGERAWIVCCLVKQVQTLYAIRTNPTANSLLNKGIVTVGSGSVLGLPFHIRDFVWEYVNSHRGEFVPAEFENYPQKVSEVLEEFEASLLRL
jgi:hypothetical protein